MIKKFCVKCERCNSEIFITSPNQIGGNIGRDRILCGNCYEWENNPASF